MTLHTLPETPAAADPEPSTWFDVLGGLALTVRMAVATPAAIAALSALALSLPCSAATGAEPAVKPALPAVAASAAPGASPAASSPAAGKAKVTPRPRPVKPKVTRPAPAVKRPAPSAKPASAPPLAALSRPGMPAQAALGAPTPVVKTTALASAAPNLPAWCRSIEERLPSLPPHQCEAAGLLAGEGRSVSGVPLWYRDMAPARGPVRLRVLVLGGIHGDEMASVNLVFDWIERSLKLSDEPIHWRMVPLVNPDGLLHKPSTRVNARGVDLNRNFSTPDWASQAKTYWVGRTGKDPRRFPGPSAMSEPETRWVQQQVEQFKPNLIVSVHAPFGVLDFDGPPPVPGKLGSLYLDQVGIYPGSLGNYGGVVRQVPVVTLELKNARQVAVTEVGAMWSDLLEWIDRRLINVAQSAPPDRKVR